MDALTDSFKYLEITEDSLFGKDLSAEEEVLEKLEKAFNKLTFTKEVGFLHYLGKVVVHIFWIRAWIEL